MFLSPDEVFLPFCLVSIYLMELGSKVFVNTVLKHIPQSFPTLRPFFMISECHYVITFCSLGFDFETAFGFEALCTPDTQIPKDPSASAAIKDVSHYIPPLDSFSRMAESK